MSDINSQPSSLILNKVHWTRLVLTTNTFRTRFQYFWFAIFATGLIVDNTGSYVYSFYMTGGVLLIAFLIPMVLILINWKKNRVQPQDPWRTGRKWSRPEIKRNRSWAKSQQSSRNLSLKPPLHVETFSWNLCATAMRMKFQQALHRVTWSVSWNFIELPLWDKFHEK